MMRFLLNSPLPGLTRQSIHVATIMFRSLMDARFEPAHDEEGNGAS
jgi:hypothetical protein